MVIKTLQVGFSSFIKRPSNVNCSQSNSCGTFENSNIHSLTKDTVSFKGNLRHGMKLVEKTYTSDMRELDLHCACCSHLMLKNKTVNTFLNRKIYFPAIVALERIKYEQKFRLCEQPNAMQSAYSFIKRKAAHYPEMSMNELCGSKFVMDDLKNQKTQVRQALNSLRERCNLVSHNIEYVVSEIEKLNPDFQRTEDAAFQELKRYAKMYPHESINSVLNKPEIKESYLRNLQNKQNSRLRKITPLIQQLSPQMALKTGKTLEKAYKIFNVESIDILHKRGRVLEIFEKIFAQIPYENINDKEIAKLIMKRLEALPNSKNDLNSLMIKGSQKTSNSFVELLITRARNTNEHVKPHHRKGDNGESNYSNYISLCGKCNSERRREEYGSFVDKHPEMIENTQKQIDEVCDYINQGIFVEHDTWPKDIKEPLGTESQGKIVINYDKLNLKQAKENREKRIADYIEAQKNQGFYDLDSKNPLKRNPRI